MSTAESPRFDKGKSTPRQIPHKYGDGFSPEVIMAVAEQIERLYPDHQIGEEPAWANKLKEAVDRLETDQVIGKGELILPVDNRDKDRKDSRATKSNRFFKPFAQAAVVGAIAFGSLLGGRSSVNAEGQNITPSIPTPSASLGKSPDNYTAKQIKPAEVTSSKETASASQAIAVSIATTNTYGPAVTQAWLQEHPQNVQDITTVTDSNGNVIKRFSLSGPAGSPGGFYGTMNGQIDESDYNSATNAWSVNKPIADVPMSISGSIASSSNGADFIIGGMSNNQQGVAALEQYSPNTNTWQSIPFPEQYQPSGSVKNVIRLSDSKYLGNNTGYAGGGLGQELITVDQTTGTASLQAVSPNIGGAFELEVTSQNSDLSNVQMTSIGMGLSNYEYGVDVISLSANTGEMTATNFFGNQNSSDYEGELAASGNYTAADGSNNDIGC